MIQHLLYLIEPRAILLEQRWALLAHERHGWHTERFVLVGPEGSHRGQKRMYPLVGTAGVEPVTVDRATFDEAWEGAGS